MAIYINENLSSSLFNMEAAMKVTEEAFSCYGKGEAFSMTRQRMRIRKGALHMLPGGMPYKGVIGYKAYTSFRAGLIFKTHLYSAETGEPLAIIDCAELGRLRTGAASGIAAKYLSRENSETVFIFGTGFQAEAQIEAVCKVRNIKKIYCSSRTAEKAEKFASDISNKFNISAELSTNIEKNISDSDIIITITSANHPLFDSKWITKKGIHINAAGSNALIRSEIPEKIVETAKYLVVDSKEVASIECGDILPSLEKGRIHWNNITELGEIVCGKCKGRTEEEGLSIFESQGMGLLDVAAAQYVYEKAVKNNIGIQLPF